MVLRLPGLPRSPMAGSGGGPRPGSGAPAGGDQGESPSEEEDTAACHQGLHQPCTYGKELCYRTVLWISGSFLFPLCPSVSFVEMD